MSKLWARFSALFSNRTFVGMDKTGNRYFTRTEEIDGIMKEKRWVLFKGDQDPTSIPGTFYIPSFEPIELLNCSLDPDGSSFIVTGEVKGIEWICWLNGQRKKFPTPEEMVQLETRRELVKLNVALLKKEEEERKAREGKASKIGQAVGPDLKSFIQQFPTDSEGNKIEEASDSKDATSDKASKGSRGKKEVPEYFRKQPESSEPSGSGESFQPGTWQPPM